jgi:hypothetical protein
MSPLLTTYSTMKAVGPGRYSGNREAAVTAIRGRRGNVNAKGMNEAWARKCRAYLSNSAH